MVGGGFNVFLSAEEKIWVFLFIYNNMRTLLESHYLQFTDTLLHGGMVESYKKKGVILWRFFKTIFESF